MSTGYVEKIKILLPSGLEYLIERVSVKFVVMEKAYVIRKQFSLCLSCNGLIFRSHARKSGIGSSSLDARRK